MLSEANREIFMNWTLSLVNGSIQNHSNIKDFEWKNGVKFSNFDLMRRLQQCLDLKEEILTIGLCLVKRTSDKNLKLTDNSLYKLAVVCIFIAQKFYSDFHYDIEDFSISSGISIKDLNNLEIIVLELLDYDLILTERDYYGILFLH